MAATDQPYRSQKVLDIVFGVSCALMLLTTVWMFAKDYGRDFKSVQRKFRDVEATMAERDMVDKLPDPAEVAERRDALAKARQKLDEAKKELAPRERELLAKREQTDEDYRGVKADYDAFVSYRNIARDEVGTYPTATAKAKALTKSADEWDKTVSDTEKKLAEKKAAFDKADLDYKAEIRAPLEPLEKNVADAEDNLKKLTGTFDRYAKLAAQKGWTSADAFRNLPIVDGFAAPTKINQIWLPDLTIDYGGFRDVPRYDRCTTCHLGIDKASYDKATLSKLGDVSESERLNGKLRQAQTMLVKRQEAGEKLGFDPNDLPGERSGSFTLVLLLLSACVLVAAGSLGVLEQSWRLFIRVLTVGLALTLLTGAVMAVTMPRVPQVKTVPLSEGEVNQFCAHPRLDLFVDSNSPHPVEKFGCTTCHAGQGSATSFNHATHTPNDAKQEKEWKKDHNWASTHYWDFPMLSKRFVESSCLKCHHQVTDLIRQGVREEAPKLLRGYNLVKEMGCFGCHEIQGVKNGRWVGPDLRLEPSPAIDLLSPAEQERAKSDPLAPPGSLRKVGPSLRRLAEKSPHQWTRQWISEPRGFREDTRMPHFYHLSTNKAEALPEKEKHFPAAEIHAITHYLFHESGQALRGKDTYRLALLKGPRNLGELQEELGKKGLVERDYKDLLDVSRRFADLALLASPTNHKVINANATRQRQLQEQLRELHKGRTEQQAVGASTAASETAITAAASELKTVTAALEAAATPVGTKKDMILDGNGDEVKLPPAAGDAVRGRLLFTEKGCLACHAHEGTAKKGDGVDAVLSDANFGPELSRIKDKLGREGDPESARRWLVQWVMNPNVYHPRTRMPITHLKVEQANDIAAWLLAQAAPKWDVKDPDAGLKPEEMKAEMRKLARVYLARVGWVRDDEQEKFLPLAGASLPGIPKEKLAGLPRDADERLLEAGALNDETLKVYVGKKSIGRLGCYACHDIPGFETAKPIGVGLNDWGKKDNERLAFEDGKAFVASHFNIVQTRGTNSADVAALLAKRQALVDRRDGIRKDAEGNVKPEGDLSEQDKADIAKIDREIAALEPKVKAMEEAKGLQEEILKLRQKQRAEGLTSKEEKRLKEIAPKAFFQSAGGQRPFEESFFHAIEHHQREGFLHLKLMEPRSYDYGRRVKWDDRLRMPQFQFARTRMRTGESAEAYQARQEREEAEAREAVMTFILGLVAEPVPLKYVHQPKGDRAAEVAGRQVIDRYNCASCHQVQPGQFDLRSTPPTLQALLAAHSAANTKREDMPFLNHNAWFGTTPAGGKLTANGFSYADDNKALADSKPGATTVRLSDALRFAGADGVMRDIPAGVVLELGEGSFEAVRAPLGGTWADLMLPYVLRKKNYDPKEGYKARSHLPPTLVRQGERIQPDWMYRFLLNPTIVRPYDPDPAKSYMLLRMPKFNMSPEEARALVNYFTAVARQSNPGAGVSAPFVEVPQKEPDYWRAQVTEYARYAAGLPKAMKENEAKLKKDIDALKKQIADKGTPAKDKARLTLEVGEKEKALAELPKRVQEVEGALKGLGVEKAPPASYDDLYSRRAILMLSDTNGCFQCHSIGSRIKEGAQGPNLALAAERVRPEWAEKWIHAPKRMFPYEPVMNALFQLKPGQWDWAHQSLLPGDPLRQTRAVRDLIMDGPRLAELIKVAPAPAPEKPKEDKEKKEKKE